MADLPKVHSPPEAFTFCGFDNADAFDRCSVKTYCSKKTDCQWDKDTLDQDCFTLEAQTSVCQKALDDAIPPPPSPAPFPGDPPVTTDQPAPLTPSPSRAINQSITVGTINAISTSNINGITVQPTISITQFPMNSTATFPTSNSSIPLIAGISGGVFLLIILLIGIYCYTTRKPKQNTPVILKQTYPDDADEQPPPYIPFDNSPSPIQLPLTRLNATLKKQAPLDPSQNLFNGLVRQQTIARQQTEISHAYRPRGESNAYQDTKRRILPDSPPSPPSEGPSGSTSLSVYSPRQRYNQYPHITRIPAMYSAIADYDPMQEGQLTVRSGMNIVVTSLPDASGWCRGRIGRGVEGWVHASILNGLRDEE
ncbi:hypothetical protein HDU79_003957 [Rhizoclosmatium sp. JEL0117]|nr:hypothetical protein HDU79_003957 [Rhizoclosmatium sp. JEL0117]